MTRIATTPPVPDPGPRRGESAPPRRPPGAEPVQPRHLEFRLCGGPWEPAWQLRWRSGKLEYQAFLDDPEESEQERTTVLFAPSPRQWREFWESVEALGVWRWAPEFERAVPRRGTTWELDLRRGEREVRSRGRDAWPGAPASEPSPEFRRFLAALAALIDGRAIG
jgi:hypothetical protein